MPTLQDEVQAFASALKEAIEEKHGKGKVGFALLLFDFGPHGELAYASTADRDNMIQTMEEFIDQLKKDAARRRNMH